MGFNVLIVDDSALVRASLTRLLHHVPGVTAVDHADSLAQTRELAGRRSHALVILDIFLPDGMGYDLIRFLKQQQPAPCVAMLSLRGDKAYRDKAMALGADWFFDKGASLDQLLETVRHLAQASPHEQPGDLAEPAAALQLNRID